jgi:hypothetical protein
MEEVVRTAAALTAEPHTAEGIPLRAMGAEVLEAGVAQLLVSVVVEAAIPLRAAVADLTAAAAHPTGAAADLTVADMVDNDVIAANLHNRG